MNLYDYLPTANYYQGASKIATITLHYPLPIIPFQKISISYLNQFVAAIYPNDFNLITLAFSSHPDPLKIISHSVLIHNFNQYDLRPRLIPLLIDALEEFNITPHTSLNAKLKLLYNSL